MSFEESKSKIEELLLPFLAERALELYDFEIKKNGKTVLVQITIDKLEGGINIDQCAEVNRYISNKSEELNLIPAEDYTIEVSSPGLDRPLKTKRDFERVVGEVVNVYLLEPVEGKSFLCGEVLDISDTSVTIQFKGKISVIPLTSINKATRII